SSDLARERAGLVGAETADEDLGRLVATEREVTTRRAGLGHAQGEQLGLDTDVASLKRICAGRNVAEAIATVGTGHGLAVQLDQADTGSLQGNRVAFVDDGAHDLAGQGRRGSCQR